MTITLDWWLLPTTITLFSLWMTTRWINTQMSSGDYSNIGNGIAILLGYGLWLIGNLIIWIIYLVAILLTQ